MDTAGKTVWLAQRLTWGNLRDETWLAHLPGQYKDRETGLFYNLHRYYDPRHGRYITPDPVGLAGGLNGYAYAGGDPVGWVDPLGLSPLDKHSFENSERPDFYVGPDGPEATLPSTGYRYMRYLDDDGSVNNRVEATFSGMSAASTYIGFEKYDSGRAARNAYQVSPEWSDARIVGVFDTLQLYEKGIPKVQIPYWGRYDPASGKLEPFPMAYTEFGSGMAVQLHADRREIKFPSLYIIPE